MIKLSLLQQLVPFPISFIQFIEGICPLYIHPYLCGHPQFGSNYNLCSQEESSLVIITEEESVVLEIHKKGTQYQSPKSLFTTYTHDYDLSIKTTSNSRECNNRTMCCRKCSGSFATFNQTNSVQILKIIVLLNSVKFSSLYFTPVIQFFKYNGD